MRVEREQARQVRDSSRLDSSFDIGADARQIPQFQAEKPLWQILGTQHHQPIRLLQFGANFCEIAVRRNADRAAHIGTDVFRDPTFN